MTSKMTGHRVEEMGATDRRFAVIADFVDDGCEPFGVNIIGSLTEFEANWMVANPDYLTERETFMIERKVCLQFAQLAKNSKVEA